MLPSASFQPQEPLLLMEPVPLAWKYGQSTGYPMVCPWRHRSSSPPLHLTHWPPVHTPSLLETPPDHQPLKSPLPPLTSHHRSVLYQFLQPLYPFYFSLFLNQLHHDLFSCKASSYDTVSRKHHRILSSESAPYHTTGKFFFPCFPIYLE